MTTFLLIRHAAHVLGSGVIAGRSAEAVLSPTGIEQAAKMAQRVASLPVKAIYCSPMMRTQQTARPLAERLGLAIQTSDALSEIDFGQWQGRKIDELRGEERWKQWNTFRSGTRAPGGELMGEVQARIVDFMLRLRVQHANESVAIVSHGDVIKAAVACFLGVPLDLFQRIEISLASVSVVVIGDYGPWVLGVNETGDVPLPDRLPG